MLLPIDIASLAPKLDDILAEYTTSKSEPKYAPVSGAIIGVTDKKETVYLKAGGVSNVETGEKLDVDLNLCIFSCTKALTCTAILILHQQGKLDINKPAYLALPKIKEVLKIDEGDVNDDGTFKKPPRPADKDMTILHLMTHTAGFAYAFANEDYLKLDGGEALRSFLIPTDPTYFTTAKFPLLFEPGTKFTYGHNTDWLGLIVKEVTGQKLGDFLKDNLFDKIDMSRSKFSLKADDPLFTMHVRNEDGSFSLYPEYVYDKEAEIHMGGHGCYLTIGDYLKFLRMWLNKGTSPDTGVEVLTPETFEWAIKNHFEPGVKFDFDIADNGFLPEGGPGFGYTLAGMAYAQSDLTSGRSKGSAHWTGLPNVYYWVDFNKGIAGMWGAQFLQYLDPTAVEAYNKLEKTVYANLK